MGKNLQLLQALNARICHDLAGSIGTIDNCIGLMELKDKSIRQKAKLVLSGESANLVKKIQFFRECYSILEESNKVSVFRLGKVRNITSFHSLLWELL